MKHSQLYKEFAPFYDLISADYFSYEEDMKSLEHILAQGSGKKVLEIGVGTANAAIALAKSGYDVTGIDCSGSMLDIAKKKVVECSGLNIRLKKQDFLKLNLDDKFDSVLSYEGPLVLINGKNGYYFETYLNDENETLTGLTKMNDHLKDNGLLIMSVKNERNETRQLTFDGDKTYSAKVNQSYNNLRITHTVTCKDEAIVVSVVDKRIIPFQNFNSLLQQANFDAIGLDQTQKFYIA
ncbi:MAG: class I SAM-dependent methyltransferase [Nanoarchaeota archaeon]|nr:class I SAM-dependent methyltransferase [Nanoarchaeota archaeon]